MDCSNPFDHDPFPPELTSLPQWLVWRLEPNPSGKKPRKVPYYVSGARRTGTQGSDEDRASLADYGTAAAAVASGNYTGLGFALLPGDGLVGIDLDGITASAERAERAARIIDACDSYTESSPSGDGVHIFCRGDTETFKSNLLGIEVFSGRQFLTMTGQHYGEARPVRDVPSDVFDKLRRTIRKDAHDPKPAAVVEYQPTTGDKIHDALAFVSPDVGYDDWLRVGMALHAELGDSGLHVWDAWSARSAKYPGNREVASHWRSFRAGGGVTIGTVFGLAKDAGWKPPRDERPMAERPVTVAAKPDEAVVIDPKAPLTVARQMIANRYTAGDKAGRVSTLHFWRGDWYVWDGTFYRCMIDQELAAAVYAYLDRAVQYGKSGDIEPVKPNQALVAEVLAALRATQLLMVDDTPAWIVQPDTPINADDIIPCSNGFLIISSRTLIPATPALFITATLDFPVIENPPDPSEWQAFLGRIWETDTDAIGALQEAIGYMLTDATDQQKAFMLVGPKRSGKGTILRIIEALVGRHNKVSPSFNSLGSQFGLSPLVGKRVAMISDARLSHRSDQAAISENILRITGEDSVSVDRKYREPWNGKLPTKFLVATNELPSFSDASAALASRFIILRFYKSFIGQEDFTLTDRLKAELPGILMWALDGLQRMRQRGRLLQPASGKAMAEELEEMTSPVGQFVDDCCVVDQAADVHIEAMFNAWRDWCNDGGREHPGTVQAFGKNLVASCPGVSKVRRNDGRDRVRVYTGIRLRGQFD